MITSQKEPSQMPKPQKKSAVTPSTRAAPA